MKRKRQLIAFLEQGPATTGDVAAGLGISSSLACGILCGYLKAGLLERERIKGGSKWRLACC